MGKVWFTPLELSKLALPGLPRSKRAINRVAEAEGWKTKGLANKSPSARRRRGAGGGWEYHAHILPTITTREMAKRGLVEMPDVESGPLAQSMSWRSYENAKADKKRVADFRFAVVVDIDKLQQAGMARTAAVATVRQQHLELYNASGDVRHKFSRATAYNWLAAVQGKSRDNWLPLLLPRHRGSSHSVDIRREIIDIVRTDYLRPEKPSFAACYERVKAVACDRHWPLPNANTLRRRALKNIPYPVQVLLREGVEALEAMFPPQKRDRTQFHALEAINADGHIWDVFVHDNDNPKPYRPVMCAIQDLYSGKILGYRIGRTLGADIVRLSFGDVFRDFGIPSICWLDNGREFAAKLVTGGAPNRFRFKVKEEEPTGFLTALGVDVRWTRPYRGQSKPIERAFRDFCDHIAKHPAFAGAYTGNKVTNKPSNYGSKSIPLATFKAVVKAGVEAHNAKEGRRTLTCVGKYSFNQVFARSYAQSTIRRASDEQLRMCLLAGELKKSAKHSGSIQIHGNTYWAEDMARYAGDRFVVRYDPDALHASVFIYLRDGTFLCEAPCWDAAGFADVAAGRKHANVKKQFMKSQKALAALEVSMSIKDVVDYLPEIEAEDLPETKVVQPVFEIRGNRAIKAKAAFDFEAFERNVSRISRGSDNG